MDTDAINLLRVRIALLLAAVLAAPFPADAGGKGKYKTTRAPPGCTWRGPESAIWPGASSARDARARRWSSPSRARPRACAPRRWHRFPFRLACPHA